MRIIKCMKPVSKTQTTTQLKKWFGYFFFGVSIITGVLVTIATLQNELDGFEFSELITSTEGWSSNVMMLGWVILAILIMILTSGIRISFLLKAAGYPITFCKALRYGILSRYYVLITPWGLGGQPIMMGIMVKDGIPFGLATSVPMLDLFFMRFAMAILTTLAFILFGPLLDPYLFVFALVGYFFTSFLPVLLILFSFDQRFSLFVVSLIQQYWFKKTASNVAEKVESSFRLYREAFQLIKHHLIRVLVVLFSSFLSQIALLIIPYFVLAMFQPVFHDVLQYRFDPVTLTGLMTFANTILGVVPTIGSAGAAEFTFSSIFSSFIIGHDLFWATFIWRLFVFYLWLVIGLLTLILNQGAQKILNKS